MSKASSQSKTKSVASISSNSDGKSGRLDCCVPEPPCGNRSPLQLQEAVRVICSNEDCSQSGYMHPECFIVWEAAALNYMKCRGRARGWNDAQRRGNVWTGKGYHLAYKSCACLCGHGYLKKDLDWKPPTVAGNIDQPDNAIFDKKKKKKDKANQRPKLNYNDSAKDIINFFPDDKDQFNKENVATVKTFDTKIQKVPSTYDSKDNDWEDECRPHFQCDKADNETLGGPVISPSNGETYWNSTSKGLNFIEIEQKGIISFWCPITNHGTVVRSDGKKFLAYLNGFFPDQVIDQNLLIGSSVTFSSPDGTSAQNIVVLKQDLKPDKYKRTYLGTVVYWNSVQGYGFVRSPDIEDRVFLFLGSFDGKVDVTNLYGRNLEFQLKQHENQNLQDIVVHAAITDTEYQIRSRKISESVLSKELHENEKMSLKPDRNTISPSSYKRPQNISPYQFLGTIVTFKPDEAYGFIRSPQVTGDVFFSLSYFHGATEQSCEMLGANVYFGIYDSGKKSMEARNVTLAAKSAEANRLTGIVTKWNTAGSGLVKIKREFWDDPVFVTHRELKCDSQLIQVGVEVELILFLNLDGLLEAHDVHLVGKAGILTGKGKCKLQNVIPPRFVAKVKVAAEKNNLPREKAVPPKESEDNCEELNLINFDRLTDKKNSKDLIKEISVMGEDKVNEIFGLLKGFISHLCVNVNGSQIVASLLKRSAEHGCGVTNKIVRMLTSEFHSLADNKHGCHVLEAALQFSSDNLKAMLVEKMMEFDFAQFSNFWVYGCPVFAYALQHMDPDQEEVLASILTNHCGSMATHSKNHGALRSFLLEFGSKPCIEELAMELEPMLLELVEHKFGSLIVEALTRSSRECLREIVSRLIDGKIKKFAANEISCKILETAVRYGTSHQQQCWIEEVCSVDANESEKPVSWLAKHQFGYKVVIAMLQVSAHKQIHGDLKASILFKQEDMLQSLYGKKILQLIKIEQ